MLENEVKSCKTTQDRTRIREVAQEVAVDVTTKVKQTLFSRYTLFYKKKRITFYVREK